MYNKVKTILIASILPILFFENIKAQVSQTNRVTNIYKTTSKISVDGVINEDAWQAAAVADSFINKWPTDTGKARLQTEVRIMYDEQFIYFGIKATVSDKAPVIQSLKRDVNPYYSDGVSVVIDAAGKSTSGYTFGVNAAGAQMDGIVQVNSASFDWDTKWYSATKIFKDYWTAELAIPFKSLRFSKNIKQWSINFIRNDMTNNCFSTWNQVPIQFFGANLNCLGKIYFENEIPLIKSNNAFIPYVSAKIDEPQKTFSSSFNAGLDAKIAINSSLNLDATINPDFSQVDVDRQFINLDRFNVLLPERRTFFLENSDLFSNMGIENAATPFVSRRIGLTQDGSVVPIIAGLRLTGNINPALRIGVMNIQSAKKYNEPAQNYLVAAFDHKIFKRSNIRGIITNRKETTGADKNSIKDFNRVAGAEFNFLSDNSKFNGRAGYYYSFNPGHPAASGFGLANVGYTNKNINIAAGWSQINSNFIADLGFTPRLYNYDALHDTTVRIGYSAYTTSSDYFFYPKSKKTINSIDFSIKTNHYYTTASNKFIEFNATAGVDILFANRREAGISFTQNSVNLPFATTIFSETGSLAKAKYDFGFLQAKFLSNFLRPFSWALTFEHGGYYNGRRTSYTGSIKYRAQPWGNFALDFIYNDITLNDINIHPFIISPTIEFAFANNFFWTTFLQYNTQIKNFNVNSRLQWRFKPMSDIFLVYTDNYLTDGLQHKNRNLVFKINYWIN